MSGFDPKTGEEIDFSGFFNSGAPITPEVLEHTSDAEYFKQFSAPNQVDEPKKKTFWQKFFKRKSK